MPDFDLNKLTQQMERIQHIQQSCDKPNKKESLQPKRTFLDSKQEIIQLYLLFMFFGVNMETIMKFPVKEYDPD